jgi:hypothetical protein
LERLEAEGNEFDAKLDRAASKQIDWQKLIEETPEDERTVLEKFFSRVADIQAGRTTDQSEHSEL